MISDKALSEFVTIYKEEFGIELSKVQATEKAVALLTITNTVFKPIKKEWLQKNENEHDRSKKEK